MEIGLAIGGAFLSSGLQVFLDRLTPQGQLLKMFQREKRDVRLFKKLKITLLGLQAVLSDALNKQASNPSVRQWLNELQDAVDGAENLIEEVNYEVLRLKVEGQHQYLSETSNQQVSDEFFDNIKEKLEDTIELLEELVKQIGHLGLINSDLDSGKQETRNPSTSVVDESGIFGRQDEIDKLVGRLLFVDANGETLTVIPIVGMAGIGKTTLARSVYNDEEVKKHFDLKAWICVSEAYDASRITKELLQEIGSFEADNNLNQLQIKLKERLKGKKFLIVLDDVWNENYNDWDDLRNLFVQGKDGSKIIVTTRNQSIALMMRSEPIILKTLSTESSWPLFKTHAFENMDPMEHPEHEEIGKKITDKCKGLPLALKTLAGMLRSKSDVEGWRRILRSEIWELPSRPNDMLPALMLSYNDLPSYLKRCFAYLAIFPKDYPFCKEQVIQLWIANGLVQNSQQDEAINYGDQCFLDLKSRSLVERDPYSTQTNTDKYLMDDLHEEDYSQRNTEKYLMHDLVNDLARLASSQLCISLEENKGSHLLERTRHLSYSMGHGDFEIFNPLCGTEQLRTLLPINFLQFSRPVLSKRVMHNILPRLTTLRALSLSYYQIKDLPGGLFNELKLLRFLDLSWTLIEELPDSICVLYNLETLLLSFCKFLKLFPLHMEKLINLRYLDISGTSVLYMPLHPSLLKSLHVLLGAKFVLDGQRVGFRTTDLSELHNLNGSLSILELQNVADGNEASKAKMKEKKHVEMLSLEWSESIADNSQSERDVLDALIPNTNIKGLQITGYRGTKFPNSLADDLFRELVKLCLSNCKDCDSLPALGQLPSLKSLTIRGMARIIEVTEEFYGSPSSIKPFNSLKCLEFEGMLEWKQWYVLGNGEFPELQRLRIKDCPKLTGQLPENLCSLTELIISDCPDLIQLSSLKKFEVVGSPKVGVLLDHALQNCLYIQNCQSLTSLLISSLPNTLKSIQIRDCENLKLEPSVSETISNMFLNNLILCGCDSIDEISPELVPRARYLQINSCHSLRKLLIPSGTEGLAIYRCENLEIFSVACEELKSLSIYNCEELKSLPERMHELLPSLKVLSLHNCPEVESFPEGGLPFNVETLGISNCEKLVNGRKEWRLQGLTELRIFHDGSDEDIHWDLAASIRCLAIRNVKTLSSKVLRSLTSLETLDIYDSPHIQSLLEEGLPKSLTELSLHDLNELQSLPTEALRRLTSLRCLFIESCNQLESLPESALPSSLSKLTISECDNLQSLAELPSSLSELTIRDCDNLRSLAELPSSLSELTISECDNLRSLAELPSSLSELTIWRCPNLKSLPVKGMPSSISKLSINDCPLLKPSLEFEKGDYWPKIAHIPTIVIDDEEYL